MKNNVNKFGLNENGFFIKITKNLDKKQIKNLIEMELQFSSPIIFDDVKKKNPKR